MTSDNGINPGNLMRNHPLTFAGLRSEVLASKTSNHTASDLKSSEKGTFQLRMTSASGGSMTRDIPEDLWRFFDAFVDILAEKQGQYGPLSGRQTIERMLELDPLCSLALIQKYLDRIVRRPDKAEKDLLKIATYAYLHWRYVLPRVASETSKG